MSHPVRQTCEVFVKLQGLTGSRKMLQINHGTVHLDLAGHHLYGNFHAWQQVKCRSENLMLFHEMLQGLEQCCYVPCPCQPNRALGRKCTVWLTGAWNIATLLQA